MSAFKNVLKNEFPLLWVFLFLLSCNNNNPMDGHLSPCPAVVPASPYNSPIWHPSGNFIGFNYTPLKRITFPYGEHCTAVYEFDLNLSGFWLIDSTGTNQRRIFPYRLQTPAWSPDGQWIAFVSNAQIYKMKFTGTTFDTTSLTQLTFEGRNFFPAWSPDGEWIVYDSNSESPNGMNFMWKMKANGLQKNGLFMSLQKAKFGPLIGLRIKKRLHTFVTSLALSPRRFL
jgi:hypothetical protein